MPNTRDQAAVIDKLIDDAFQSAVDRDEEKLKSDVLTLKVACAELGAMALSTVTRYDYWRRQYCAKAGMSEAEFDAMTDECIQHEAEPAAECQHLVVNTIGRCVNCGKRA